MPPTKNWVDFFPSLSPAGLWFQKCISVKVFRSRIREVNRVNCVPLLTTGTFELRKLTGIEFTSDDADLFLNDFFLSRISTELLSLHFLTLYENPSGFVSTICDPVAVCQKALSVTTDLCRHHYGRTYDIQSTNKFCFQYRQLNGITVRRSQCENRCTEKMCWPCHSVFLMQLFCLQIF